jgi:ABC-type phosphate transport system substrate-binding protein
MKIYVYNNEIYSLENVTEVTRVSKKVVHIHYTGDVTNWSAVAYKDEEEMGKEIQKIANILSSPSTSNETILFDNLYFRKSDLVCTQLSGYHIKFIFGGHGGHLIETSIGYNSEKISKAKYQELLAKLQ